MQGRPGRQAFVRGLERGDCAGDLGVLCGEKKGKRWWLCGTLGSSGALRGRIRVVLGLGSLGGPPHRSVAPFGARIRNSHSPPRSLPALSSSQHTVLQNKGIREGAVLTGDVSF